ncbi:hypothetical protein Tco_0997403, partial [Tanacetum coccineum]
MTRNKCYLTKYEDYDGGFVSFGDGKGRISGKDPKVIKEDAEEKPTEMDESGALDKDGEDDQPTRSDTPVNAAGLYFTNDDPSSPVNAAEASNAFEEHLFERFSPFKNAFTLLLVSNVTLMDDTKIFGNAYDEDVSAEADLNNLETTMRQA